MWEIEPSSWKLARKDNFRSRANPRTMIYSNSEFRQRELEQVLSEKSLGGGESTGKERIS